MPEKGKPVPKKEPVKVPPAPSPVQKPVAKNAAHSSNKKAKKRPFSFKHYFEESLESITKFFQFVFAGDYRPRQEELLEAAITFMHYN